MTWINTLWKCWNLVGSPTLTPSQGVLRLALLMTEGVRGGERWSSVMGMWSGGRQLWLFVWLLQVTGSADDRVGCALADARVGVLVDCHPAIRVIQLWRWIRAVAQWSLKTGQPTGVLIGLVMAKPGSGGLEFKVAGGGLWAMSLDGQRRRW